MKSFYKLLTLIITTAIIGSCSTNSAASEQVHSDLLSDTYAYLSPEAIVYASSISNLVATFPKFRNDAINREVSSLKVSLSDYLGAVRDFNQSTKHKSLEDFEKYYKKIQKLRKFMTKDDDEVLNRYMVKIKTNINLLEASQSKTEEVSMSSN
ncbi:hypothetical protein [Epilithonimonas sp. UC225_85]|uniref:hypothetical protein n=1 Tax=Epilithonimonas sp. UC225_85 TaxID=3350167 RepID=UPI0036D2EFD3